MRSTLPLVCTCVLMASGCVERAPGLSPADRERLREFVGTEAPDPGHSLDVRFDNGVRLLGYDIADEELTPGQPTAITWYWHAAQDLDDGWRLFTHVADSTGESRYNQDGAGVVREIYQPGRWRSGQYIRDVQEITLPSDWNNNQAIFYVGLWNGPHRLAVRQGPRDDENRVRAVEVPVATGPSAAAAPGAAAPERPTPPRPPPATRAARASDIEIDGRATEAAWQRARPTSRFVNTLTGGPGELNASARVLWDDEALYVSWTIEDDFVSSDLEGRDAHLWEQDAFEIMIDHDGDQRRYFEMQVSPTGELFDTRYDSRRQPQPFGHVDWSPEVQVAVHVDGTANDERADEGWSGEIRIPWDQFGPGITAPEPTNPWRLNFYVMDKRQGGAVRSVGWSPTLEGDFHVPARFGRVLFDAPPEAPSEPEAENRAAAPGRLPTPVRLNPQAARHAREQIERVRVPAAAQKAPPPRR